MSAGGGDFGLTTSVGRALWTLQRFGLSPPKLARRIANRQEPKVLCVSIPKAGTHLLERALCLHPRVYRKLVPTVAERNIKRWGGLDALVSRMRPGQVIVSHLPFRAEYPRILSRRGIRSVFLVRDPHDIVVSQVHYTVAERDHYLHGLFAAKSTLREQMELAIRGDREHGLRSIGERLVDFGGWLEASDLVVRFEDLIGSRGGGDSTAQADTLQRLYRSVGLGVEAGFVELVQRKLFSATSPTFRKGSVGQWGRYFDRELEDLFDATVGEDPTRYGYPVRVGGIADGRSERES